MLVRRLLLAMVVLSLVAAAGPALPRDSTLDLVTGVGFAPLAGEELPEGGLLTEVVTRAFAAVGLRYQVRFMPWKRGYDGVVSGMFLGGFPYTRTAERDRDVLFSGALMVVRQLVYASTRTGFDFQGPSSFRGRSVCAPVGYALPAPLAALVENGATVLERLSDLSACVRMVATGRVDAFVMDEFTGRVAIAEADADADIRPSARSFGTAALHLVVSRTNPEAGALLAAFDSGLKKLHESGEYDAILARHLGMRGAAAGKLVGKVGGPAGGE